MHTNLKRYQIITAFEFLIYVHNTFHLLVSALNCNVDMIAFIIFHYTRLALRQMLSQNVILGHNLLKQPADSKALLFGHLEDEARLDLPQIERNCCIIRHIGIADQ